MVVVKGVSGEAVMCDSATRVNGNETMLNRNKELTARGHFNMWRHHNYLPTQVFQSCSFVGEC